MKYRAKDIAQQLGVSPATVSLVLNNRPGVSEAKRHEIIRKITEMGCDYLLKDERVSKGDIGFIVYKCQGSIVDEYPFFSYLIENVNKAIERHNYTMTIIYMDKNTPLNERLLTLEDYRYAGYLVYAVEMYPEDLEIFSRIDKPCVFMDNPFPESVVDTVTVDNNLGVCQAVDYLYQHGHRQIGYIKSKVSILCFEERMNAFERSLKRRGLNCENSHVIEAGYLERETETDIREYLQQCKELPSAFFADNDLLACRAVQAFKAEGIRVPEDVSIIGFDNRPICGFTEPAVSSIEIPGEDMGKIAVEMLLTKMAGERKYPSKCLLGTALIERDSVKKIV